MQVRLRIRPVRFAVPARTRRTPGNPKDSRKDSRHNACSLGRFSPPATLLHNIPSIPLCPNEIYYIIQYIGPKKASQWRAPDIKDIFIKWNKIKPYIFMLTGVNISDILYINIR